METGGQCAMITGLLWMLMWLVGNLDTLALVCMQGGAVSAHDVNDDCLSYFSPKIQLLFPVHSLGRIVLSS